MGKDTKKTADEEALVVMLVVLQQVGIIFMMYYCLIVLFLLKRRRRVSKLSRKRKRDRDMEMENLLKSISTDFRGFLESATRTMDKIMENLGYEHVYLSKARKSIAGELEKFQLSKVDRVRALSMITKDVGSVDTFFSLSEEERVVLVDMLLAGSIQ